MIEGKDVVRTVNSTERGKWGEGIAARHLESHGYQIVERNWRFQKLEIDLIARHERDWVFVEVKVRKTGGLEEALASVDLFKQQRIINAAHQFLKRRPEPQSNTRFDIICIEFDTKGWRIQHIPDAFISMP
jgi:putative endonuclease